MGVNNWRTPSPTLLPPPPISSTHPVPTVLTMRNPHHSYFRLLLPYFDFLLWLFGYWSFLWSRFFKIFFIFSFSQPSVRDASRFFEDSMGIGLRMASILKQFRSFSGVWLWWTFTDSFPFRCHSGQDWPVFLLGAHPVALRWIRFGFLWVPSDLVKSWRFLDRFV